MAVVSRVAVSYYYWKYILVNLMLKIMKWVWFESMNWFEIIIIKWVGSGSWLVVLASVLVELLVGQPAL